MASLEISDRDAIVEVLNLYSYCLDERDWLLLDQVFTADALGSYGGPGSPSLKGREAIVASIRAFLDGCGPSQHLLGNHIVEVDGDEAVSRCKARVYHFGAGERAALAPYECFGVYRDRLSRTPEGWRIAERVFDVQHAVGDIAILHPGPVAAR